MGETQGTKIQVSPFAVASADEAETITLLYFAKETGRGGKAKV